MAVFLLWNTQRKNLDSLVVNLVREHRVDVLLLVEYHPSKIRSNLSTLLIGDGLIKRNETERFGVFGRSNHGMSRQAMPGVGGRAELWDWRPEPDKEARFVVVHGLDRRHK